MRCEDDQRSFQSERQAWEEERSTLSQRIESVESQSKELKSVYEADKQQWASDKAKLNQHLYTLEIGCLVSIPFSLSFILAHSLE